MITSYEDAERYIGRKADKNRKIYNGMIKPIFISLWGQNRRNAEKQQRKRSKGRNSSNI